MDLTWIFELL